MNVSSIGSASSVTSGFLSEPPLSPGPAPVPASAPTGLPQLRTVDTAPAAESVSGSEPQAPVTPLAPAPVLAPEPSSGPGGSEPRGLAPAAPAETPSLESTLLRMRLVTPDQIASAMREEAETGRSIAEIVVANGWVSADDIARIQASPAAPIAAAPPPDPEPVAAAPMAPVEPAPPPEPVAPAQPVAVTPVAEEPAPAAAPTPAAPAPAPVQAPEQTAPHAGVGARVFVRLENGERIDIGSFDGFEAAKGRARTLMAELQHSAEWPFLSGRFVRPEAIVSIDVDLTSL